MDKYITRAELRLEPFELSHEKYDDKLLESLQELTYNLLNTWTWQVFEKEGTPEVPVEKRFDGGDRDKDTMFFDTRLITLVKVKLYNAENSWYEYGPEYFSIKKKFLAWKTYGLPLDPRAMAMGGGTFGQGVANIGIVGVWGWEAVPAGIKYVQGRLIQKLLEDKSFATKFASESVGDYSYNVKVGKDGEEYTGDAEIDAVIKQYRSPISYSGAY